MSSERGVEVGPPAEVFGKSRSEIARLRLFPNTSGGRPLPRNGLLGAAPPSSADQRSMVNRFGLR